MIRKILVALILFTLWKHTAVAEEKPIIERWYSALEQSQRSEFEALLSADAVIELKQLGITQTKEEFIESLNHWKTISKDLAITFEWEGIDATSASAEVCYRFPDHSFTNLEIFVVQNGLVVRQEQQRMKEGC